MNPPGRGLVIVYTGDGKGKTSAALGNAFRALGHGMKVLVVQFLKGDWPVTFGEMESAKAHPRLEFLQKGEGFVGIMGDQKPVSDHREAARAALATARERMLAGRYDMVILDEVNVALSLSEPLVEVADVLSLVRAKPPAVHLVLTGRGAPRELIDAADLVTEMREVKHPYRAGVPAQKGVDF